MKIPSEVKIAGRTFQIKKVNNFVAKDGLAGEYSDHEQVITLQEDSYHQEKVEQVFWHEIVHGLDINYLNKKMSEDDVDAFATGLYAFLKDNKLIK